MENPNTPFGSTGSNLENPKTPFGSIGSNSMVDEPKTLTEAEFNEIRAKALEIIKTHTREEATKIFLAGCQQVAVEPTEKIKEKEPKRKMCGKRSRSNK